MLKFDIVFKASVAILLVSSCQDITNFRDSYEKIPIQKVVLSKNDSLASLAFDNIKLGTIKKPRIKYANLVLRNTSNDITLHVYSLSSKYGLEIISPNGLPIIIPPGGSNVNQPLQLKLNTSKFSAGNFNDEIYINESNGLFINVEATILD